MILMAVAVVILIYQQLRKNLLFKLKTERAELEKQTMMKRMLEENNLQLEIKVKERTEELSQSNASLRSAIEELRSTQEQLIISEKVSSVGKLISNLSHELNNPLGAIRASTHVMQQHLGQIIKDMPHQLKSFTEEENQLLQLLITQGTIGSAHNAKVMRKVRKDLADTLKQEGVSDAEEISEMLVICGVSRIEGLLPLMRVGRATLVVSIAHRMIQVLVSLQTLSEATERTRKILSLLRTFDEGSLRRGTESVDLQYSIQKALQAIEGRMGSRIKLTIHWASGVLVRADPEHLALIWTTLLMNAVHAIHGESGKITLATQFNEGITQITITDSGEGISTENQTKIFQPFFTTKEGGEGSGLGLYLCQKIVWLYEGSISFQSAPGHTTFVVQLPAASAQVA